MVTKDKDRISQTEMKDALRRSGYLIESRVETVLVEKGYFVQANYPYPDPQLGKTRELDLYSYFDESSDIGEINPTKIGLFGTFLIECVNNPQPIVFFSKTSNYYDINCSTHIIGTHPSQAVLEELGIENIEYPNFKFSTYHHYWKVPLATQYCSFTRKTSSKDWMACHEEGHQDTFSKICDVTNILAKDIEKSLFEGEASQPYVIDAIYPLIIFQGDICKIDNEKSLKSLKRVEHVIYKKSVFCRDIRKDFFIDVISEMFLPKYLDMIGNEVRNTFNCINENKNSEFLYDIFKKINDKVALKKDIRDL